MATAYKLSRQTSGSINQAKNDSPSRLARARIEGPICRQDETFRGGRRSSNAAFLYPQPDILRDIEVRRGAPSK